MYCVPDKKSNRLIRAEKDSVKFKAGYDYMGRRFEKKLYDGQTPAANGRGAGNLDDNASALRTAFGMEGTSTTPSLPSGGLALVNPFRFSSEFHDDELGLVYYNYRYYNPQLGRWTKRDPIGEYNIINTYLYSWNNPVNYIDYLGTVSNRTSQIIIFNFGFDKTIPMDSETHKPSQEILDGIQRQLQDLSNIIKQCCSKFQLACGTKIKATYNYDNSTQKAVPQDPDLHGKGEIPSYGLSRRPYQSEEYNNKQISSGPGVNVLITTAKLDKALARADEHSIFTMRVAALGVPYVLAHEYGHRIGVKYPGGPNQGRHSGNSRSLMYPEAGNSEVDVCYCEKIGTK